MKANRILFPNISSDLGFERPVIKGQVVQVNNCWHFYTSGDSVESLFRNDEDFCDGMNRIFAIAKRSNILILAFVLMDTHIHFILYGEFDSCNRFIHEYIRLTSMYLSSKYQCKKYLKDIKISHQPIDDDRYLKTAICYVIKNPVAAGLPFSSWDYPWSSGALYFRHSGAWTSPGWAIGADRILQNNKEIREVTKSRLINDPGIQVINGVILPNQYVAVELVERLFRTHKAYHYFLSITKESDVESRGGIISHLSIPLSEMRENRRLMLQELFGVAELWSLDTAQRLRLAKCMKRRYNCSPKQIARLCGLVYDEVRNML